MQEKLKAETEARKALSDKAVKAAAAAQMRKQKFIAKKSKEQRKLDDEIAASKKQLAEAEGALESLK